MTPIHLCGMVADYSRHCYHTEARLWRDDEELTPITWFRAKPDAMFYPGEQFLGTVKTWERPDDNVGFIGERPATHTYSKGAPTANYPGDHFCGRKEDFSDGGQTGQSEEITTDSTGASPCCKVPVLVQVCGLSIPAKLWAKVFLHGDCSCGDGTVLELNHSSGLFSWNGTDWGDWWTVEGFPYVVTDGWPPPGGAVQLGTCETPVPGAGPMYLQAFLGINCPPLTVQTDLRFLGDPDDLPPGARIGTTSAGGLTILSQVPFHATTNVSESHMEIGNCNVGSSGGVTRQWHVEFFDEPPE